MSTDFPHEVITMLSEDLFFSEREIVPLDSYCHRCRRLSSTWTHTARLLIQLPQVLVRLRFMSGNRQKRVRVTNLITFYFALSAPLAAQLCPVSVDLLFSY